MIFLVVFIFLIPATKSETLEEFMEKEAQLLKTIFSNYSADLPATYTRGWTAQDLKLLSLGRSNPSIQPKILEVNITLVYSNLLMIDEPGETIHMIIDTYLEWMDFRLKWDPRQFDNISTILTGRNKVWVPDVFPYDTAEFDWGVGPEIQQVVIYSTGKVALLSSAIIGYNCELDITNFPFDDQVCAAKYSCYYSNNQEMILQAFYDPGYDVSIMSSNAWTVVRSDIQMRTFHDYAHNWNYSEVNYLFTIRRSDTYYVVLIIIPSYVLSFLCTVGLLWSKITANNYMEKLSLGFAGILAMVLILQMTTQEMPKTLQLPILSLYTLVNLSTLTVASLAVLVIGKAEGKCNKSKERTWTYGMLKKIHIILLIFFLLVISLNLIILCTKKGEVRNGAMN